MSALLHLWMAASAASAAPPESDRAPRTVVQVGERVLDTSAVSAAQHVGPHWVWATWRDGEPAVVAVTGSSGGEHLLGRGDRPSLSPDGHWVVFVGVGPIASLWAVPTEGGAPVQLTNRGLVREPGRAPPGFVPPPAGPVVWRKASVGWTVRWQVEGRSHKVAVPR